ncbi:hypothetical protein ACLK1G_23675 [Pseudomonas sp. NR3]|uniref:hypothetical protein n=1 Tax=Pseudomonas sp. NR3 TaxID=3155978 RepID=UPI003B67A8F7
MTIHAKEKPGTLQPTLTGTKPSFYIVSTNKLTVMYWLTFELYLFYWVYKNWKTYQAATNTLALPLIRTVLGLFFIHALFIKIEQQLKKHEKPYKWSPRLLASGLVFSCTLTIYPFLAPYGAGAQYLFPLVAAILNFYCLLKAQTAINHLENDPEGSQNSNITIPNCVWIASLGFGLVLWIIIKTYFFWWYFPRILYLTRWEFLQLSF